MLGWYQQKSQYITQPLLKGVPFRSPFPVDGWNPHTTAGPDIVDGLREVHDKIKDVREARGKYDGMTCAARLSVGNIIDHLTNIGRKDVLHNIQTCICCAYLCQQKVCKYVNWNWIKETTKQTCIWLRCPKCCSFLRNVFNMSVCTNFKSHRMLSFVWYLFKALLKFRNPKRPTVAAGTEHLPHR